MLVSLNSTVDEIVIYRERGNIMGYKCQHCEKHFDTPAQVVYHKRHRECQARFCGHCKTDFKTPARLNKHLENQKNLVCLHCQKRFCDRSLLERHLRTVQEDDEEDTDPLDRDRPIQPVTGYENDDGYKTLLKEKDGEIRNRETIGRNYMFFNRKIDPTFTYSDLENIITDIYL